MIFLVCDTIDDKVVFVAGIEGSANANGPVTARLCRGRILEGINTTEVEYYPSSRDISPPGYLSSHEAQED